MAITIANVMASKKRSPSVVPEMVRFARTISPKPTTMVRSPALRESTARIVYAASATPNPVDSMPMSRAAAKQQAITA